MPQTNRDKATDSILEKLEALKHATIYCLEAGCDRKGRIYYRTGYAKILLDALGVGDGGLPMSHGEAFTALIDSIAKDVRQL